MSLTDEPKILDIPTGLIQIPVTKNGRTELHPLRQPQIQMIERANSLNHPVFRGRPKPDTFVFHVAMGAGKTEAWCIDAINYWQDTGKPPFFCVDSVTQLKQTETIFRQVFEKLVGHPPVVHRYGKNENIEDGEPHVVFATPQLLQSYPRFNVGEHPLTQREYGVGAWDEGDKHGTPQRIALIELIKADRKWVMTGTLDRGDDPEVGHVLIEEFGKPLYTYSLEDSFVDNVNNKPEYVLYATNIWPVLHHILNGKVKLHELNEVYTSRALNEEYLRIFEENYTELNQPQSIIFCKTIEHAEQLTALMRERGYDPLPIHNKNNSTKNLQEFHARPNGGIAISVNMLRRGHNFHDLGLIMETSETKSTSRFMQTIGRAVRAKNVRFVDVTTSFKQIQHVRLYARRLQQAYRRSRKRESYVSNDIDMSGVRIHPSVEKFMRDLIEAGIFKEGTSIDQAITMDDIIAASGLKEQFFFALRAHAASIWQERSDEDRLNSMITLTTGAGIRLPNGIVVTLQEEETVNVRNWLNKLPRTPGGDFDLSPEQQTLLDSLDVNLAIIENDFYLQTQARKPSSNRPSVSRVSAKNYFDSDEFWIGLEAFRQIRRAIPDYDMRDIDVLVKTPERLKTGRAPRRFLALDESPTLDDTFAEWGQDVNMKKWFNAGRKYFDQAPKEVQSALLAEGVLFGRGTTGHEIILRSHIDTLRKSDENRLYPNENRRWEATNLHGMITVHAGSQIRAHDNTLVTLPADFTFMYQDYLHVTSTIPDPTMMHYYGLRETSGDGKWPDPLVREITASSFFKSDYFSMGLAAQRKIALDTTQSVPVHASVRVSLKQGTPIHKLTTSESRESIVLNDEVSFNLSLFYRHLNEHIPYLPENQRVFVERMFPPLDQETGDPLIAPGHSVGRTVSSVLREQDRTDFKPETLMFDGWMYTDPDDLTVGQFPDNVRDAFMRTAAQRGIPLPNDGKQFTFDFDGSLDRCRFLLYRYLVIQTGRSGYPDKDVQASRLLSKLETFGFDTDKLLGNLFIDPADIRDNNPEMTRAGQKVFESLPEDRRFEFAESLLREPLGCKIIGYPGYVPEFVEVPEVDSIELELLVSIAVEKQENIQMALSDVGIAEYDNPENDFLPAGSTITTSTGQVLHLKHDTQYSPGYFREPLEEFVRQGPLPHSSYERFIWEQLDQSGFTEYFHPEGRLLLTAYGFADWLSRHPDDYSFAGVPHHHIVPAGTPMQLSDGRAFTTVTPQYLVSPAATCRKIVVNYLLEQDRDGTLDLLGKVIPTGATKFDTSLLELGYNNFDWGYSPSDFIRFGEFFLNAIPEERLNEFLSGLFKDIPEDDMYAYEPDHEAAVARLNDHSIRVPSNLQHINPIIQLGSTLSELPPGPDLEQ